MPPFIKFSQFVEGDELKSGGDSQVGDEVVGLRDNANTIFTFPGTGFKDEYGNYLLTYETLAADSVNRVHFINSTTGNPVIIETSGSDASRSILMRSTADGSLTFQCLEDGNISHIIDGNGNFIITLSGSGFFILNGTSGIDAILDEDDLSSNSATALSTQKSIKAYVDSHVAGSSFFISTDLATTANLSATYDNGSSGIGATLTASANGAGVVDGVTVTLNDIILFKDQTNAFENGIYTVTQVGDASNPAIYTRYSLFDQSSETKRGFTTFTISGNTNARKAFQLLDTVTTIGTDDFNYQQDTIPTLSSSTDNAIARFNGVSGGVLDESIVLISDLGVVTGATQIDVGVLSIGSGTVQTTVGNNLRLVTDPTDAIYLSSPSVWVDQDVMHAGNTDNKISFGADTQDFQTGASSRMDISNSGIRLGGADARVTSILTDTTMAAASDTNLYTGLAIKTYVDSSSGSSVTLTSAGGTETLVYDGTGPALANKGLTAGTGISLVSDAVSVTITNSSPASDVTLANAGGTETLVNDGTGPSLATKGLTAGTGISLGSDALSITITNSDPASSVTLTNAGTTSLVNDGTGPSLATKGLAAGTGMAAFTTSLTDVTINLDIPVSIANGGTNATSIGASGTLAQSNGTSYAFTTATYPSTAGTSGKILISNGTNIVSSTPTYPNAASTSGKVIVSDGTNFGTSTVIYPSGLTINRVLYASSANTIGQLGPAQSSVLVATSGGTPTWSSAMTNGQVIIGSTSGTPTAATLTAGTGVSIANASGSITISASGGGVSWTEVTGTSQSMAVSNGYIANNVALVTLTLPTTAAIGSVVKVTGKGAGLFKIAQNASQTIYIVSSNTTTGVGGSLTANQQYNSITLRCITANNDWVAENITGDFTIV